MSGTSDLAQCQMSCFELDTAMLSFVFEEGDVQFGMSETHAEPKIYVIDTRYEDRLVRLSFETADSSAMLSKIEMPFEQNACDCE